MNHRTIAATCLVALLLAGAAAVSVALASDQAVAGDASGKLPTDGEVRHAMSEIHALVANATPAIRQGAFGPAEFRRLSDAINDRLEQASAHNRLPSDMREQLAGVLSPLATAARSLKTDGERAFPAVVAALESYDRAVDHSPGRP
ncbi:MAG TPA: hypothetical protein VK196_10230 [Magnetospirillum sp.]|nr:hypothetical protein [Magnetospirillum sp.]